MSGNSNKHKVTLESLLHLKKSERPKADFWESFERDFDRRRLHALVERPSWRDILVGPAFRVFALGLPAMALVLTALIWSPLEKTAQETTLASNSTDSVDQPVLQEIAAVQQPRPEPVDLEMDTSRAASQFVVDAIHDATGSSSHFRKVLYTPAIRLSVPTGAFYVRDNLSSSNYKVTTADVKLGRNF